MNAPRNPELRIVSAAIEADCSRATLRIDADCPVPAPALTEAEARVRRRADVEKELDRLHQAAGVEQLALGQHMNWLIASQAIFIHAFLMVFVVSGLGVAAVNHWLLGGLALLGIGCALALHTNLDRGSRTLALLVVQRRAVEVDLTTVSGRTPNLPKDVSKAAGWAGPLFVVVWLALLAASAAMRF